MHRTFRRVFTVVKENCSLGYAKIVTAGGFSDVDVIVIKATAPNDSPLQEKYVQELLKIFAFSPPSYRSFSLSFSRRFRSTRCWRVGLKCLLLLHRLLQSIPENSAFRVELLRSRDNGSISLHQRHIREDDDYASFIKSYARLLDEALNSDLFYNTKAPNDSSKDKTIGTKSSRINEINKVIELLTQMQSIIDRVIDCKPAGRAAGSFLVRLAMKHIIRESFICYRTICKDIDSIKDSLLQLPYRSSIEAIGIYKKAAVQADHLSELYDWSKVIGVCSLYEFPEINRIPKTRIQALEASVERMWQLTESSSSSNTSTTSKTSSLESPASGSEETVNKVAGMRTNVVVSSQWETFEDSDSPVKESRMEKPLFELLEEKEDSSWEDLLEASASFSWEPLNLNQHGDGDTAKMEPYNPSPSLNPFYHDFFFPTREIK